LANHIGWIAMAAIWLNTVDATLGQLNRAEIHALMRGADPLTIRRTQLWAYWPLTNGSLRDFSGNGRNLIVSTGKPTPSSIDPELEFIKSPINFRPRKASSPAAAGVINAPFIAAATTVYPASIVGTGAIDPVKDQSVSIST
jgi:hypothetical protein